MASRQDVPPSRMSRLSNASAQARLEIDEVSKILNKHRNLTVGNLSSFMEHQYFFVNLRSIPIFYV